MPPTPPRRRPWTFMVYMAGDNGKVFSTQAGKVKLMAAMTEAGYRDLAEMATVGTTDHVAVPCLFDTSEGAYLVEVRQGRGLAASAVRPLRQVNTGDPATLAEFIVRSVAFYPAEHYALVIWNHGTGWLDVDAYATVRTFADTHRSHQPIFRSTGRVLSAEQTRPIAFDDSSKDFLDSAGLRQAFSEAQAVTGARLDLIGMDACLMAMIEGGRELAPFFDYFVASQEIEPLTGWPYAAILTALNAIPTSSPREIAETIVREYARRYRGSTRGQVATTVTQSAVGLGQTEATEALCAELVSAVLTTPTATLRSLVEEARNETLVFADQNYRDLGDFAARLAARAEWSDYPAVAEAAARLRDHLAARDELAPVLRVGFGPDYGRATGMSVYLPAIVPAPRRHETLDIYGRLAFPQATGWDGLVGWLLGEFTRRLEMTYRHETAEATLRQVLDAVLQQWANMTPRDQKIVRDLMLAHGPQIAAADRIGAAPAEMARLLDALAGRATVLPAAARQTLEAAAQRDRGAPASRGLAAVSEEEWLAVLERMVQIADFRSYAEPVQLADEMSELIEAHQERLERGERVQWQELDAAFHRDQDAIGYLKGIEPLLGSYPKIAGKIAQGKTWALRPQAKSPRASPPRGWIARLAPRIAPAPPAAAEMIGDGEETVRYVNVHFPAQVLLSQAMAPLVVHVAQQYQAESAQVSEEASRMTLRIGDLTILVNAEGFRIVRSIGGLPVPNLPAGRIVQVARDRDCEPTVFFLQPMSAGRKRIRVDLFQFMRNVASVGFETEVLAQGAISQPDSVAIAPAPVVSPGAKAEPADLELRVMLGADGRTLYYTLHSPRAGDYNFKPAGQVTFMTEPRAFFQPKLDLLSTLAGADKSARGPDETRRALEKIADLGQGFYDQLFPPELKQEYRKFREKYRGKSLLITSDEPWIPWEVVRPFEADGEGETLYDDPPLCEMFRVSRWLAGRGAPDLLKTKRGAWIAPADNLQAAQEEGDYFSDLHRLEWDVSLSGPLTTVAEVEERFRGGDTDLFHFACHGNFDLADADESKLKLAGDFLRPSQIVGPKQAGLLRSRPIVFLNACHAGRAGFTLTHLGGWARKFIESGASAFIGSLWEINDRLAAQFAVHFYNRLWGLGGFPRMTLGDAFYEARMAIRQADPADPTWLAYVLYGDPHGHAVLG